MARELAKRKITVNAICPGFIATDMAEALGPAIIDEVKKRIPIQRIGEADEIADAVLYLASDSAQAYLAEGNNEWPVVASASMRNRVLDSLGRFKADTTPIASVGRAQVTAAKIIDRVGWR